MDQRKVNAALDALEDARDAHSHQVRMCFGAALVTTFWLAGVLACLFTAILTANPDLRDLMILLLVVGGLFGGAGVLAMNIEVNEDRGSTRKKVREVTRRHRDSLIEDEPS